MDLLKKKKHNWCALRKLVLPSAACSPCTAGLVGGNKFLIFFFLFSIPFLFPIQKFQKIMLVEVQIRLFHFSNFKGYKK